MFFTTIHDEHVWFPNTPAHALLPSQVSSLSRISRIFSARDTGRPPCTSPAASLLICLALTMVEVKTTITSLLNISPIILPPTRLQSMCCGWSCLLQDRSTSMRQASCILLFLLMILALQRTKKILVCSGVEDEIMVGLLFPFLLIVFATLYAFKTRKCPGN